ETNNQPDIMVWRYQKETSISVDDIRALVSDVQIKPYASRYKIYILPDAQKMTREAQNALLKTLEEPPEYAVIILLSTSRDAMLETILSRCVVLPLRPVDAAKVRSYLMDRHGVEPYQADICVAFAQGNIGRAVALATSENFYSLLERAIQILTHVKEWDVSDIVVLIRDMDRGKDVVNDILDLFSIWYRDVLLFKATRDADGIIFREQIVQIREAAQKSSYDGIQRILDAIRTAKIRLKANVSFDLTMELLLLTMKEN
ncbi:MAG: DNA polymerase III subunit delta' C-terminal domain-containing protein, partial [Lachnospiraceae bacterium]|nr:DNA polymerase III subunit delta' C-terminal domain-containing protein [Lachnospiraceae bacterium]